MKYSPSRLLFYSYLLLSFRTSSGEGQARERGNVQRWPCGVMEGLDC